MTEWELLVVLVRASSLSTRCVATIGRKATTILPSIFTPRDPQSQSVRISQSVGIRHNVGRDCHGSQNGGFTSQTTAVAYLGVADAL